MMGRPPRRDVTFARRATSAWAFGAALAAVTIGLAAPGPALGWGRNAHRAATRVAESRLTPEARAAVRELLEPGESLVDASTWADENSRNIPGSANWHFVNVPIASPRYTPADCRGNCVVSRLEEFRRILADRNAPRARRQMALRYVVHLVEDAHQPLHVGDRRDRGGNNVQLTFFRDDFTNLHQVWDSGLLREGYRGERALADALFDLARLPAARDWTKGGVEDWVNESLEAARQAYKVPGSGETLRSGMRIGREYEEANLPVATRRLAQAGVRLSEILNEALMPPRKNAVPAPHFPRPGQSRPVPTPPPAGIRGNG
ncbi:S1/P1 Nuclease [Aquisphaera giovannonii]|uniref:S1/P1 Nuclease n=1 Tax=Aquisphaera giovannonii TaxID=406548 RepID=A0A5B9W9N3_9BACT|nr:S1/P1 nuclease [Aquisphaera giovannonii]QEH37236.1 S1/P1 Nuclease [Aquisphaera giovannonii]